MLESLFNKAAGLKACNLKSLTRNLKSVIPLIFSIFKSKKSIEILINITNPETPALQQRRIAFC